MQIDVGVRIPVDSYDDSTWEGGVDTAEMEHTGRRDRTPDLQDILTRKGRNTEMSSGRVPGQSGNKDGYAGTLRAPACPRLRGDSGGGNPPPTHSAPDATFWSPSVH